jgi:hypothetical protein
MVRISVTIDTQSPAQEDGTGRREKCWQLAERRVESESMITKTWMEQLGIEDGSTLAGRVLALTHEPETDTEQICRTAVDAVRECASRYRERGVSDRLVAAWRAACIDEVSRRFAEYRGEPESVGRVDN